MEEGLFHNPVFVNHITEFAVAVVGHSEAHTMVTRTDPRTGQQVQRCPNYGSIPCSVHQQSMQGARSHFEFRGVPASFVCDSSGAQLDQVQGGAPQQFIDALNRAQQRIGRRPVLGSQIARIERDLLRGDAKMAEGKFRDALRLYQGVAEAEEHPEFIRRRAAARIVALGERATAAIAEARALPPRQARTRLRELVRNLRDCGEHLAAAEAALAEVEASEQ